MIKMNQTIERKMAEINVSSLLKDQAKNSAHLKNLTLNINVKIPKVFSNIFVGFVIISLAIVIIMLATIALELKELQAQMHSLRLMCQDKDNHSNYIEVSNRVRRSVDDSVSSITPPTFELFNQTEVRDDRHTDTLMPYNQIVSDRSTYHENNTIKRNASISDAKKSLSNLETKFFDFNNRLSFRRFEMQDYVTTKDKISSDHGLITWNEQRARRLRRLKRDNEERQSEENEKTQRQSKKKGEKRRQHRRGHKRNQLRPLIATFVGGVPDLPNAGYIGPWVKRDENPQYDLTKFHLVENRMSIQVGISGLYMISVQIYYLGHMNCSYWVLLNSEGSSRKRQLIICAANNTVSCYSSIIIYLQKGDRLSVQQQETNRFIDMREGYSQVQIMLLANDKRRST